MSQATAGDVHVAWRGREKICAKIAVFKKNDLVGNSVLSINLTIFWEDEANQYVFFSHPPLWPPPDWPRPWSLNLQLLIVSSAVGGRGGRGRRPGGSIAGGRGSRGGRQTNCGRSPPTFLFKKLFGTRWGRKRTDRCLFTSYKIIIQEKQSSKC